MITFGSWDTSQVILTLAMAMEILPTPTPVRYRDKVSSNGICHPINFCLPFSVVAVT